MVFCRLFECKLERGCIHFCRPPTLNLFLCAANLLNKFCVKRSANSRNSQQVSTETPIHKPSWPPISANKLTSYKEHEGLLKSRPVEWKKKDSWLGLFPAQSDFKWYSKWKEAFVSFERAGRIPRELLFILSPETKREWLQKPSINRRLPPSPDGRSFFFLSSLPEMYQGLRVGGGSV